MRNIIEILEDAQSRGFLGPGSVVSHYEHALAFGRLLSDQHERCLDLGAGGGIPGLVLASEDQRRWTLLDAMVRRCDFLEEAVGELDVGDRVDVICARAEVMGHDENLRERFDGVVSRSFGSPAVTAECGGAFVGIGGVLVISDPPEAGEDRWPDEELERLGLKVETSLAEPAMTQLRRVSALDESLPRRDGVPAQRPLW
jgi:16S rRNA (guanine527-N7)-methyltransferase